MKTPVLAQYVQQEEIIPAGISWFLRMLDQHHSSVPILCRLTPLPTNSFSLSTHTVRITSPCTIAVRSTLPLILLIKQSSIPCSQLFIQVMLRTEQAWSLARRVL